MRETKFKELYDNWFCWLSMAFGKKRNGLHPVTCWALLSGENRRQIYRFMEKMLSKQGPSEEIRRQPGTVECFD